MAAKSDAIAAGLGGRNARQIMSSGVAVPAERGSRLRLDTARLSLRAALACLES